MFNFIQRQLDTKSIKDALIFALIYFLLFDAIIAIGLLNYYTGSAVAAMSKFVMGIIYTYITLFIMFFGFVLHRKLFIFGAAI